MSLPSPGAHAADAAAAPADVVIDTNIALDLLVFDNPESAPGEGRDMSNHTMAPAAGRGQGQS
ncbi:hypothetical protein ACEN8K_42445, partial [Variovorax sp. CT11-76]